MKVCCVFPLESPHRGDSNEYTQYIIFNIKQNITLNYPKSAAMGLFSEGLKNEFETAVVNEPSMFEPLYARSNTDILLATERDQRQQRKKKKNNKILALRPNFTSQL